jgi:hypothetical protein
MTHATPQRLSSQARQLARRDGLPFAQHLPARQVHDLCRQLGQSFRDRLYSPAVTVWTFLSQCLDADHSCRQAVTRLCAWRVAAGLPPCSTNTGAYGRARGRLSEAVLARLARDTGAAELARAPAAWRWKGRRVKVVDGTGLSLPDTPANQQAFPQPRSPKPGCGFPLLRLLVVFSRAVGTARQAALGRHAGAGTGEQDLLRSLGEQFAAGDVLPGGRNFCTDWVLPRPRRAAWTRCCGCARPGSRPCRAASAWGTPSGGCAWSSPGGRRG